MVTHQESPTIFSAQEYYLLIMFPDSDSIPNKAQTNSFNIIKNNDDIVLVS
jgi:hypothetical protein